MENPRSKNLRPFGTGDREKERETSRKGGKKSGEARRKRKSIREEMLEALELKVTGTVIVNGRPREVSGKTLRELGAIATVERWIATGDSKIMGDIVKLSGEESGGGTFCDGLKSIENVIVSIKTAAEKAGGGDGNR